MVLGEGVGYGGVQKKRKMQDGWLNGNMFSGLRGKMDCWLLESA